MRAKFKLCVLIWPLGCPAGKNITLDGVQLTSDHATMAERFVCENCEGRADPAMQPKACFDGTQ